MVRVEVGGKPIFEIPCVDIPERNVGQAQIRRSFTNSNGTTRTSTRRLNFGWQTVASKLVVTSDTEDFDEELLSHFRDEGFHVAYLPYDGDHAGYQRQLQHLADPLELGESYAIVAYGDAAALVLEAVMKPTPKLCAVVAYYPPYMPKTSADFPRSLNLLIHLAADQKFGTRHQRNFRYPGTQSGFAESDLDEFDKCAARVAWSRTLSTLRKGFGIEPDLEAVWDHHLALRDNADENTESENIDELMESMTLDASVNYAPTMTGGVGQRRLKRFYSEFFCGKKPRDFKTKLISRTVGADRIVDEMLVSFTHDVEIDWMLPGVDPTNKEVEVVFIVIAAMRGAKVCAENIHWDQASVLKQIGLLDSIQVPESSRKHNKGEESNAQRLPVLPAAAARKAADPDNGKSNKLIPDW